MRSNLTLAELHRAAIAPATETGSAIRAELIAADLLAEPGKDLRDPYSYTDKYGVRFKVTDLRPRVHALTRPLSADELDRRGYHHAAHMKRWHEAAVADWQAGYRRGRCPERYSNALNVQEDARG